MSHEEKFADELRTISNKDATLNVGNSEWWKNLQEVLKAEAVSKVYYFLPIKELYKETDSIEQVRNKMSYLRSQGLYVKELFLTGYIISW